VKRFRKQSGLSTVELMIGAAMLITVFSITFRNLVHLRAGMKRVTTSGPHMYFESFAVSRLKLFYAKLMQWTTHVRAPGQNGADFYCNNAAYFAYSPIRNNLTSGTGSQEIAKETLGLDLRLALSTFSAADLGDGAETLISAASARKDDKRPWGAMIPFHQITDEWEKAHPFSKEWCDSQPPKGPWNSEHKLGSEMCEAFSKCTEQAGISRFTNQIGNQGSAVSDISNLTNTSMCFVFVGNLFSRAEMGKAQNENKSAGLKALDFPSVIGLAVANARFVNNTNSTEISCEIAATEMNRSLKVSLTLFTALHADLMDIKKLQVFKTVREITGEKLGVAIPNCNAPGRAGDETDAQRCLKDPTWHYECSTTCN
jgi:hypothetical protein